MKEKNDTINESEIALELYALAKYTIKTYNFEYDEDLLQELVTEGYRIFNKIDLSKGKLSTFLVTCMKNKALEITIRKKHRKKEIPEHKLLNLDSIFFLDEEGGNPLTLADVVLDDNDNKNSFLKEILIQKIYDLSGDILKDYYFNGFSQKEIAKKLNCTPQTISAKIIKETQNLKEIIEKDEDFLLYKEIFSKIS